MYVSGTRIVGGMGLGAAGLGAASFDGPLARTGGPVLGLLLLGLGLILLGFVALRGALRLKAGV